MTAICHCGRRGLYSGLCWWHAEGFAKHRSTAAKKSAVKTRITRFKLCRNGLHTMTPENTLVDGRGPRCRACKRASDARYVAGKAETTIRTAVLPHVPKRSPMIVQRHSAWELARIAEARAEYQTWLGGKNMLDLADRAVA